jgi:retrograde regulation protein 2
VAFLVNVLAEAIPHRIREAHFCQGGVREGYLFKQLPATIRKEAPLEVTTRNFAPGSRLQIQELIKGAIPKASKDGNRRFPPEFGSHVIEAFTNVMYVHMFMSKETASTSALYSTSSGLLASTLGVSHQDRARLALMLQARYRGELPPREVEFRDALRSIISPEDVWWAQYLGRVGFVITCLYPSGKVDPQKLKVLLSSSWSWTLGKKGKKEGLVLKVSIRKVKHDPEKLKKVVKDNIKVIEKAGKKKHWIGKKEPWGMKVEVRVAEEQIL